MFRVTTVHYYRIFVAVEMLRFYTWLKQILRKMDNNLNWAEIESIMGEWIRQKISGITLFHPFVIFTSDMLNSFSIFRRTRDCPRP